MTRTDGADITKTRSTSRRVALAILTACLAWAGTAQAALFARPGGMVYDDVLNVTWLQDWNVAGVMTFEGANSWAANLVYGGYDDWRLPSALNADGSGPCGPAFYCNSSEMGHMYYANWGGIGGESLGPSANAANLALFRNLTSGAYWTGTPSAQFPDRAWIFDTDFGGQESILRSLQFYAVAVRPGDVLTVPEPQSILLMGLGVAALAGAVVSRGRRRH